ncbi:hypothetical protein IMG5_176760 [Ichthyophthirius multifiliis]|uniref:Transmembrane protein n=1 Tax=Ichthyophthirius multifiliis TaxID=5932 RepID=G0R2C0_ICHMU|nr:hypothetical protein IMG5_176760 [Ichthyophthirius multifiliis]EGR28377.1 hypothetical protein IMG5_176760 [Ichthyophthirius multifiliis]|eukprot:XP_004027722.1 hypothetical protein IMG5_176760 [Ichthyophthirius multifiliis]
MLFTQKVYLRILYVRILCSINKINKKLKINGYFSILRSHSTVNNISTRCKESFYIIRIGFKRKISNKNSISFFFTIFVFLLKLSFISFIFIFRFFYNQSSSHKFYIISLKSFQRAFLSRKTNKGESFRISVVIFKQINSVYSSKVFFQKSQYSIFFCLKVNSFNYYLVFILEVFITI